MLDGWIARGADHEAQSAPTVPSRIVFDNRVRISEQFPACQMHLKVRRFARHWLSSFPCHSVAVSRRPLRTDEVPTLSPARKPYAVLGRVASRPQHDSRDAQQQRRGSDPCKKSAPHHAPAFPLTAVPHSGQTPLTLPVREYEQCGQRPVGRRRRRRRRSDKVQAGSRAVTNVQKTQCV